MPAFVALLRAVNVGGSGRLSMAALKEICAAAGFTGVRTYIASGNAVFAAGMDAGRVKAELEARLLAHGGRPVGVLVRTAGEMAAVLAANPFPDAPPERTLAIFLDEPPPPQALAQVTGRAAEEELRLGAREIYVRYGAGMGRSRLRIPAAARGTARNMKTVAKLAELAAGLGTA